MQKYFTPKGRVQGAFRQDTDIPSRSFEKLAMDIVGPLKITLNKGNRYILTLVELSTSCSQAIPLQFITSEAITDALLFVFSSIGFPEAILSDREAELISSTTQGIKKILGIREVSSSSYHPETNGVCERFNRTLKQMLARSTAECPNT